MCRVTVMVADYLLLTLIWLFHCQPNSAWAAANLVYFSQQLVKIKISKMYPAKSSKSHNVICTSISKERANAVRPDGPESSLIPSTDRSARTHSASAVEQ